MKGGCFKDFKDDKIGKHVIIVSFSSEACTAYWVLFVCILYPKIDKIVIKRKVEIACTATMMGVRPSRSFANRQSLLQLGWDRSLRIDKQQLWWVSCGFYAYQFVTNITNVEKFQFLNVTEICFVTIRALLCGEKLQIMRYDFMRHCTVERVSIVCL